MASQLHDVSNFIDLIDEVNAQDCKPANKLPIIARNLPQYDGMYDDYINPIDTDLNTLKCDYKVPTDNTSLTFA